MKRILIVALLALGTLQGFATEKGILYLKSPANHQVMAISANGQWACGVYLDESDNTWGFRWNLTTNKIESTGNSCAPCGISNNGVLAGSFETTIPGAGKIEVAGIWDGSWTMLELPNTKGCLAYTITPDGKYVTGTDNTGISYVWEDGKLKTTLTSNGYNTTYALSEDGSLAGGWAYQHDSNRNSVYWTVEDGQIHDILPDAPGMAWQAVRKFTPDNKKLLFWGGYAEDPNAPEKGYGIRAILDIESNNITYIYPTIEDPFNFDLFDMSADGKVVGYEQDDSFNEHAVIYADGITMRLQKYLESQGADFCDQGILDLDENDYYIARGLGISSDAKVFGLLYYGEDIFETGAFYSMVVLLDQDVTHTTPVNVEAKQVTGIMTAEITWNEPLGDKSNLQGYDIYRNGSKINTEVVEDLAYYDCNLQAGTYKYNVIAVYDDGESEYSNDAEITIAERKISGPCNLIGRQKGYSSAYASWQKPATNLIDKNYYAASKSGVIGFGGGEVSFESGILFPESQMNLYEGYHIEAVTFYPLQEQGSWIVNVYTHEDGALKTLGSFPVSQELEYGISNTIVLPRKITLQKGHDLLIGIQTNVVDPSYTIQGVFDGTLKAGYTDLIRAVGEDDFYSLNVESGGASYDMSWGTGVLLAPSGISADIDNVDHYDVCFDENDAVQSTALNVENKTLGEGNHTVKVRSVYANGNTSDWVNSEFVVAANVSALKAITPTINVKDNEVSASWTTPKDDDATTISYCNDDVADNCPTANEDCTEFYARIDFTSKETAPYNGYEVKSLSFFPLSNATFSLQLNENEELVAEVTTEDAIVGEWNTIELEEPIVIDCNKTYHYIIDCYDCPVNEAPLAIDTYKSTNSYSSLLTTPSDLEMYGWSNTYYYCGRDGNWLMKMNIAAPDAEDFNISGYDVFIDGKITSELQNSVVYDTTLSDENKHILRVDAHYADANKVIKGNVVYFQSAAAGIVDVESGNCKVGSSEYYNIAGQRVSKDAKGIIISGNKKFIKK